VILDNLKNAEEDFEKTPKKSKKYPKSI